MIYVTHDQVEAMTLADRIAVLSAGHLMQHDTPDAIYNRPAAVFVAGFTGAPPMNLFDANVAGGVADMGDGVRLALPEKLASRSGALKVGVRPENVRLARQDGDIVVPARVGLLEPLGAETLVTLKVGAASLVARFPAAFRDAAGTALPVHVSPAHLHLFDPASGAALH
jgi:multiple sugar transport system ATP-binding protein